MSIYRFDDCELDTSRVVLRRAGAAVPVEPQVFDVLQCLVDHRGELVSKEELLDTVWGSRFVSESALTSRIKSARRAVGDDGSRQAVIRTVHGKGYKFVAAVTEVDGSDVPRSEPVGDAAESPGHVHAPPHAGGVSSTLPLSMHALIGRDELLDGFADDLVDCRLLTIAGPAGVGKTSIGLELARRADGRHRDGVVFVELVGVDDAEGALAAVATALDVNIRQDTSLEAVIVDMLRPRDILLLVDNCEHLVEPLAALVEQILRSAPGARVLATSREPLAIPGERVRFVEPLDVSRLDEMTVDELATVPAVALFVERARAADGRFELTSDSAPAVAEICRRLDGIPLALELAASRAHAIDVTEIARRLDERLRLLKAVRRGADPRHGTLIDAISWSYDLLDDDEQRLFSKLAVFAGSFDLDDAEAICDDEDVLDLLTRLSQRSMVAVRRPSAGGTRYEMLETMREFGRSRLDDLANVEVFQAHARHYAGVATVVEAELQMADEFEGVRRADGSFADLRAAQRFAVQSGDVDTALALLTSIREYAMRSLRYEVFTWADAAAPEVDHHEHPLRPVLTAMRAYGAFVRGEFDAATVLADVALADERAQGVDPVGLIERVRGNVRYILGDRDGADASMARLIEIGDASGNASRQAHANYMASVGASSVGDPDLGRKRSEAAFDAARRSGNPTDLASAWMARGFATRHDDESALDAFASADRLARSAGNRWLSAFACTEASSLRVTRGDLRRGCEGLAETVDIWYRAGEWAQQWLTLSRCVIALERIGRAELAAEVVGAIDLHATIDAPPVMPTVRDATLSTVEALVDQLGTDRVGELRAAGEQLPLATLVHRARSALLGGSGDATGATATAGR